MDRRRNALRPVEDDAPGASPPSGDSDVRTLLRAGRKIDAIKRWRELTGIGLKEAKDAVARLHDGK
jgi:ribosomal protein L7/L12